MKFEPIKFTRRINNNIKKSIRSWFHIKEPEKDLSQIYPGAEIADPDLVEIGERVSFGGQVRIFNSEFVKIGHDTMIAFGTQIITVTHDYSNHPMWKQWIYRPVEIGNHVWIGTNAIIFPGVRIGDYAVIGAGAVISAHVPEKAIVAGNPARIIGFRDLPELDSTCVYPGGPIKKGFFPESKVTKAR